MALAHLWAAGIDWSPNLPPVVACSDEERAVLSTQLERRINTVPTTSMGRLFDAVSSLAGVRHDITFEGQAAIELEALIDDTAAGAYRFGSTATVSMLHRSSPVSWPMSTRGSPSRRSQHDSTAASRDDRHVRPRTSGAGRVIGVVGLSGGVFQNATLASAAERVLQERDFLVLTHRLVPPNDGGSALGQAVIAAERAR